MIDANIYNQRGIERNDVYINVSIKKLKKQIEEIRYELNNKIIEDMEVKNNSELIELSHRLDKLINKYIRNK